MEPEAYLNTFAEEAHAEESWPEVTGGHLCEAALKQKNRAGGPDGWTGSELAAWPYEMWADLAVFLQWFEKLGAFPTPWQWLTQTHIPTEGNLRSHDLAQPASKLRPISLMSCWWRVYVQARLMGDQAQAWIERNLHTSQAGGRRGRDCQASFVELAECYAKGYHVATLDLKKAFDHITPQRACAFLKWFGFPKNLADIICGLWGKQKRILRWHGDCLADAQHVSTSIPQGDAFSPRVMNLLLSVPVKHITMLHPETVPCVFMDDRSWGSPGIPDLLQVLAWWRQHSHFLGLRENFDKSQFTHRDVKVREDMKTYDALRESTLDHLQALGAVLGKGDLLASEVARIQKAAVACAKVRLAPVTAGRRHFVATMAAASKAVKLPKKMTDGLETKLRRVGYSHPQSNPCLARLVLGHGMDVQFQSGAAVISAIARAIMRRGFPFLDWNMTAGPARRIRKFLKGLQWVELAPWCWQHFGAQVKFSLLPDHEDWISDKDHLLHVLREGWRAFWWDKWRFGKRHDAVDFRNVPYNRHLTCQARTQAHHGTTHEVAAMIGAFVSPAWYDRMTHTEEPSPLSFLWPGHSQCKSGKCHWFSSYDLDSRSRLSFSAMHESSATLA
jgi:hypothetical protein